MVPLVRSLYRHYQLKNIVPLIGASFACGLPLVLALVVSVLVARYTTVGLTALLVGLGVTGVVLAVVGRVLDLRFQGKNSRGTVLRALGQGWAEGLVVGVLLLGLFQVVFSSFPFYWSQATVFGWLSLGTLVVGTGLVVTAVAYFLPVRRREGLGLVASLARSFHLMNAQPGVALAGLVLGLVSVAASIGTLGLFPGFGGLTALHQGMYDRVTDQADGQ